MSERESGISFRELGDARQQQDSAAGAKTPEQKAAIETPSSSLGDPSPQELFSRGGSEDLESMQMTRALRALRRYWLVIAAFTVFLPGAMYVYDNVLGRKSMPKWARALGASELFESKVELQQVREIFTYGLNRVRLKPINLNSISKIVARKNFKHRLLKMLQDELNTPFVADSAIETSNENDGLFAGLTAPKPLSAKERKLVDRYLRANGSSELASISVQKRGDGLLAVRIRGIIPDLLPVIAARIGSVLNEHIRENRAESLQNELTQQKEIHEKAQTALKQAGHKLAEVSEKLRPADKKKMSFSHPYLKLESLLESEYNLRLEYGGEKHQLDLLKAEKNYSGLLRKFAVRDEKGLARVLIDSHPLREEWAKLEAKYEKMLPKYMPQHPKIINNRTKVQAIKQQLKKEGWCNLSGEVLALPTISESRDLTALLRKNSALVALKDRLGVLAVKIKAARSAEREQAAKKLPEAAKPNADLIRKREDLRMEMVSLRQNVLQLSSRAAGIQMAIANNRGRFEFKNFPPTAARKISPAVFMDVMIALLLGAILGCGTALFFESMDNRLHTPSDVYYHLRLNYLGVIPFQKNSAEVIISPDHPDSPTSDAYAHLCNNIRYSGTQSPEKRLLIASALPGEGKSTVAVNAAIRYALDGNSVLLIDSDMRRPRGHKLLRVLQIEGENADGLAEYLSGKVSYEDTVRETKLPGLNFIPAGHRVSNPAKLLGGSAMNALLDIAERNFDVVIVDCPALLPVVDATILAPNVRGVLMVVAAEEVEIGAARMALYRLQHVGSPMVGAVLNKVRATDASRAYYGSRYPDGYYSQKQKV